MCIDRALLRLHLSLALPSHESYWGDLGTGGVLLWVGGERTRTQSYMFSKDGEVVGNALKWIQGLGMSGVASVSARSMPVEVPKYEKLEKFCRVSGHRGPSLVEFRQQAFTVSTPCPRPVALGYCVSKVLCRTTRSYVDAWAVLQLCDTYGGGTARNSNREGLKCVGVHIHSCSFACECE